MSVVRPITDDSVTAKYIPQIFALELSKKENSAAMLASQSLLFPYTIRVQCFRRSEWFVSRILTAIHSGARLVDFMYFDDHHALCMTADCADSDPS